MNRKPGPLFACCTAVLLLALPASHAATISVDCDAGDSLGETLNRLARAYPSGLVPGENTDVSPVATTVKISGTCVGNFVIASAGVKLEGVGPTPAAAVLKGADPINSVTPVVEVRNVRGTFFENLTVTGGSTGIRVRHSDALIVGCEFRGNGTGVSSEASETFIGDSLFTDNGEGVQGFASGHISLNDTLLIDNEHHGVVVANGSDLVVDGGEIRGNKFGIRAVNHARAFLRQPLVVGETTGGSHITALNQSMVTLNDGVTVGGGDTLEIVNDSILEGFRASVEADLVLYQGGRAYLQDTTVEGNLTLIRFSNASIDADVSGFVNCDATSDADCDGGTVGDAFDCGHCPAP